MARRKGRFGEQVPADYAGNVLKTINRMNATGETVAPAGTSDGTAAATTKMKLREKRAAYTTEEIASNDYLSALKTGLSTLSYEQALANYRAQQNAANQSLLYGTKNSAADKWKAQQAWAKVNANPLTKYAENIFFAMGGSYQPSDPNSKYGGAGVGSINTNLYTALGLTPPTTQYAPVGGSTSQVGNRVVTKLANPLSATQKSALQKLRSLKQSGTQLTAAQVARLNRLKAKKNAPTTLP
jgi:hypothetical protein